MNKLLILGVMGLMLVSSVSATTINYYFHPQCGHCQKIAPFIKQTIKNHQDSIWNIVDTSQGSYDIPGTPFLELITNDNRKIELSGSYEIPNYLRCELYEMSTLNCTTTSKLNYKTNSFFIR